MNTAGGDGSDGHLPTVVGSQTANRRARVLLDRGYVASPVVRVPRSPISERATPLGSLVNKRYRHSRNGTAPTTLSVGASV